MSFALQPKDGSARLLGPAPSRKLGGGQPAFTECSDKVQGAIQAIQRHAADIRKEASILSTAHNHSTSSSHIKQVAIVARDTAAEAKRLLQELDPGSGSGSSTDEKKLQRLTHQKLAENLERASNELEQSWQDFVAAESAWASRQSASSSSMVQQQEPVAPAVDLEQGCEGGLQLQEHDLVSQSEADMHAAITEEYAKDLTQLSQNMQGLQRAMLDLAHHTVAQGETLDGIESSMGAASEKTAAALEQIQETEQNQRKKMKFTLCLLLFVTAFSATVAATVWH